MKTNLQVQERNQLKWPEGVGRTLISDRQNKGAWKKQMSVYVSQAVRELELLGASGVEVTFNADPMLAKRDPGVAVWYSLTKSQDTSWQKILQIDDPNPTRQDIDKAFKRLSFKHHPDQVTGGSGGDIKVYMNLEAAWRSAKAWVQGESGLEMNNCLPCDMFADPRQNMACLRLQLMHIRAMQRLGNPFVVERIMERGFRSALPAPSSSEAKNESAA